MLKRTMTLALVLVLALSLAACGGNSTPDNSQSNGGGSEWPADNEFAKQVPKPDGTVLNVWPGRDRVFASMDWTTEEAEAYGAKLREAGIPADLDETRDGYYGFIGHKDGYTIRVDYITGRALKKDEQPHYQILVYKLN